MADKKDLPIPRESSGFTLKELEQIELYKEAGLPGIIEVTDKKLISCFEMYLDGIRFIEIAKSVKLKKEQVLYLASKYNWHQKRMDYLDEVEMFMKNRILEEKLRAQAFIMKNMHVFRRRLNKKLDEYISTDDENIGNSIDFKEMSLYLKMVETLADLDVRGLARNPEGHPLVGVNAGDGVTITKLSDNTVEITPRAKSHAQLLAELANNKREAKKEEEKK